MIAAAPPDTDAFADTALVAVPVAFADIPREIWDRILSQTPAATPFAR